MEHIKTATEIAIETLLIDAINDCHKSDSKLSVLDYLGITEDQYLRWILVKLEK